MLLASAAPSAQVRDLRATPHNLARHNAPEDAQELCIFCHAPTLAGTAGVVPLWQPSIDGTHAFHLYDDVGMGLSGRVGSHTLVCLSCHDANQAETTGIPTLRSERDHPVGVPYRGSLDGFRDPRADFRPAETAMIDGKPVWWVPSGAPSETRRRNDLPLFAGRDGMEAAPLIECGTCHDPHTTAPLFLRLGARSSQLCLTCHVK